MFTKIILLHIILHASYSEFTGKQTQLKEGELCVGQDNTEGKCSLLSKCSTTAIVSISELQKCQSNGTEQIVCCLKQSKSAKMCAKYGKELGHLRYHAAVGGTDANIHEFPHMAALGYHTESNNTVWQCGGSLISAKFVLTAAHCLISAELGPVKLVRLGTNNLHQPADTKQDFDIARSIPHPDYKPPSAYNDIALIELNKAVKYTVEVKPACLHREPDVDQTVLWLLQATGWGLTSYAGEPSVILQKVKLDLFTNEECTRSYRRQRRRLREGILSDQQVCAGGRNKERDTCPGDSGGPLQIYRFREHLSGVVGVTSFGLGCGTIGIPGVYTRVSYYVSWIESIVWPDISTN